MKVAEPTIERLVQYHRLLETLREELITLVENAINKGLTSDDVAFELADLAKTVNSYDR